MDATASSSLSGKPAARTGESESDRFTRDLLQAQQVALRMILTGAPLQNVLDELTRTVENLDGKSSVASILLLDSKGCLRNGSGPSLPQDYKDAIDGVPAQMELGTCAHAAASGEVVITPDIEKCERWQQLKHLPLGIGLKAAWSQPIVSRSEKVLGTFGTYFHECREPTHLERLLVETLAETAALAIERHQEEQRRQKHESFLQRALEAAKMGAWRYDLSTRLVHVDDRARTLYGVNGDSFLHDEQSIADVLHPEDIPVMWAAVDAACDPAGNGRYQADYRTRQPDGGWRWLSAWGLAEFDIVHGKKVAVAIDGASVDVTEAKIASDQQQLLLRELSHRVRNNLAVVQSIAHQTLRSKSDPGQFADAFNGRIAALAKAHTLLTRSEWRGANLRAIAEAALEGFGGTDAAGSFSIAGDDIVVPASAAVTLSLVFHELATNAHKYGALSTTGTVFLSWVARREANGKTILLEWRESGGPAPAPATRNGFGSKLIATGAAQLNGEAQIEARPAGLVCNLSFTIPEGPPTDTVVEFTGDGR